MTTDDTESWLVLRAQAGDRAALETLLARLQVPLGRYLHRLIADPATAEDVLQDALLTVFRRLGGLRDPGLARPWSYRIASREAFRRLGKDSGRAARTDDGFDLAALPAPEPPDQAEAQHLLALIAHLPPASRAVLTLHYAEDLTLDEIAAVLGLSLGTVKSRLAYGLATLRTLTQGAAP